VALWALGFVRASVRARNGGCVSGISLTSEETLDFKKHLSLEIGQYLQVHEEDAPQNSQFARTKGAISLGPNGNIQGGFKLMALNAGKKIVRRS
jgi:hypothetical protein